MSIIDVEHLFKNKIASDATNIDVHKNVVTFDFNYQYDLDVLQ